MRPFKFALETVLKLRKMKQEEALESYAESVKYCTDLKTGLVSATRRQSDLLMVVGEGRREKISPVMQEAYFIAIETASKDIKKLENRLSDAEREKQRRMGLFLKAKQQTDILDRLKEKQMDVHKIEEFRREEKEIEDLVMSARGRKNVINQSY